MASDIVTDSNENFRLQLMFRNCREYNEEESSIFKDAITLEKVLVNYVRELGMVVDDPPAMP